MKPIDKSKIDNRQIPDAVMDLVIPLLNEAVEEVQRLQERVADLEDEPTGRAFVNDTSGTTSVTLLPKECPAEDILQKAGIVTVDILGERIDSLTEVKGIGEKRAEEIREWYQAWQSR